MAAASSTESSSGSSEPKSKRSRLTDPTFQQLIHNSRGDESQREVMAPLQLRKLIYQRIFDVASKEDTRDANRRKLYAMWKEGMEENWSWGHG